MSNLHAIGRLFGIRLLAALAPVAIVLGLWYATKVMLSVPSGEITQLTRSRSFEGLPTLSPDGHWIAYRTDVTGNGDIYLRQTFGGEWANLTPNSTDEETDPAFSPDGTMVAFASARAGISIVPRTGGEIRALTKTGFNPAWTPDGRYIIYATQRGTSSDFRTAISEGWKVDVETGETVNISAGDFHQPSVSPNGLRIAYWSRPVDRGANRWRVTNARGHVWTMAIDGSHPSRLTSEVAGESSPVWSPDGRYLYFISNRSGPSAIWRMRIDERTGRTRGGPVIVPTPLSQPAHLTISANGRLFAWSDAKPIQRAMRIGFDEDARSTTGAATEIMPSETNWEGAEPSPDGTRLVLSSVQGHLHVAQDGSNEAKLLTDDQVLDRHPRWSPDGRWVAFQSNRAGGYSIWVVGADGRGLRQLAKGASDLLNPVWSPDGEQLVVWDVSMSTMRLLRVDPEGPASETLPKISQGGFLPNDWSPDGKQIAGTASGGVWLYSVADKTYTQFRPGLNPVWLNDSRRLIYSSGGQLLIADTVLKISRELLMRPEQQLDSPRLSRDNRQLYFTGGGTDANLWIMAVGGRKRALE